MPPLGGAGLPNHHTPMRVVPGERALQPGANELKVTLRSAPVGGVKLVKTYTFRRGDYVIGVQHQIVNASPTPVNPQLYLQLVRDGNAPPGGSSFYFTFTGPAIYTEASKFQKIDFKDIEKRAPGDKPGHDTSGSDGWVAMVQHYFASAWLIDKPGAPRAARVLHRQGRHQQVFGRRARADGRDRAGRDARRFDARLFVGPQEEDKLAALAPGLELVKDYGWFTMLAKPLFWLLTQLHKVHRQLGLGDRRAWWCC